MAVCSKTPIWFPKDWFYVCCHVWSDPRMWAGCWGWRDAGAWGDAGAGGMEGPGSISPGLSSALMCLSEFFYPSAGSRAGGRDGLGKDSISQCRCGCSAREGTSPRALAPVAPGAGGCVPPGWWLQCWWQCKPWLNVPRTSVASRRWRRPEPTVAAWFPPPHFKN